MGSGWLLRRWYDSSFIMNVIVIIIDTSFKFIIIVIINNNTITIFIAIIRMTIAMMTARDCSEVGSCAAIVEGVGGVTAAAAAAAHIMPSNDFRTKIETAATISTTTH
jgi:hypothetical protein